MARNLLPAIVACFSKTPSQASLDRQLRAHLSEAQIDAMISESFPASDPPSIY